MSGHSKFANIKHKKERNDAAKGKIFTIIGREIAVAVKEGGPDPNNNFKLASVIAKAKANNMPNDTIERGIKKAAGDVGNVNYEYVTYEGYGPSGIAIIVDALTDNKNRTAANVRSAFTKGQGNVGTPGCVSFMFDRKGQIIIDKEECDMEADDLMMTALDAGAEDFGEEEDSYEVLTDPDGFEEVRKALEEAGIPMMSRQCTITGTSRRRERAGREDFMDRLAIVVPCYNEEEVLCLASQALRGVLDDLVGKGKIAADSFILFVNDGSRDRTWELIEAEHAAHPVQVAGVKLAGNVGHQFALTAGLNTAKDMCDVTISIDADLQDDVAVIEEMVDKFHEGSDIVYGVRRERKTDTFFKRTTAQAFYRLMSLMGVKTVYNHADFRLMSQRAVEEFSKYKETNLFLRGMVPLIGYQTDCVYYDRKERAAGESKYPLKKMLALAFNGISSFSIKPISLILGLGLFIIFVSFVALVYALISYFTGRVVAGWTSLILSIWFLGGLQLLAIGMVGQYIGKIYIEVKHRPRYNIEKVIAGGVLPEKSAGVGKAQDGKA